MSACGKACFIVIRIKNRVASSQDRVLISMSEYYVAEKGDALLRQCLLTENQLCPSVLWLNNTLTFVKSVSVLMSI